MARTAELLITPSGKKIKTFFDSDIVYDKNELPSEILAWINEPEEDLFYEPRED